MKAAVVLGARQTPTYADFPEPVASAGQTVVNVTASAISPVAKSRASGSHYSSAGAFPFVAGIDGVGRLDGGERVYFVLPTPPHGSMAERTLVETTHCVPLPDDLDDVTAAAIANPGMSSWAAYTERARLERGETVLVNGAAGTAGRLAVQIAKHLGAGKVIATARDRAALPALESLGADLAITLGDDDLEGQLMQQFSQGVDVVIDYLWGNSAERLLAAGAKAGRDTVPIRYIQIGSASGSDINLPSAVLRSSAIALMGSGLGSIPLERFLASAGALLRSAVPAGLLVASRTAPLSEVATAWPADVSTRRTVFTVD